MLLKFIVHGEHRLDSIYSELANSLVHLNNRFSPILRGRGGRKSPSSSSPNTTAPLLRVARLLPAVLASIGRLAGFPEATTKLPEPAPTLPKPRVVPAPPPNISRRHRSSPTYSEHETKIAEEINFEDTASEFISTDFIPKQDKPRLHKPSFTSFLFYTCEHAYDYDYASKSFLKEASPPSGWTVQ